MDDGNLTRGGNRRANAWHDVVRHRADDSASSNRALPRWALLVALAMHVAIFIALRGEIARRADDASPAMTVQMIDLFSEAPSASEIPPEPTPAPIMRSSPRIARSPIPNAESSITETPMTREDVASTLNLYNADGSIALPSDAVPRHDAIVAHVFDTSPVADNTIMVHVRPLKVRPNHFDASWAATHGGNPLDRFVADHLVKSTSIMRLPWGTRLQCAWIVIVAGCAWGPADYWHGDQSWKPATLLDEQ